MTYEPEVVNVIQRFVTPGDVVVDAGASIGNHTRLLSKLVGDTGLVLAFEPHAESYQHLAHNVGGLGNVRCYRQALWSHNASELKLWVTADLGLASFHKYDDATGPEAVEGCALDKLLSVIPRLIKVDCEGAEQEILAGAVQTLTRGVDAVVCEINQHLLELMGRSDHAVRDFMAGLGYSMYLLGSGNPIRIEPVVELRIEGRGRAVNVLFSTEEKVRARWS